MANLILNGSTSGSVTLSSPAVSGTTTLTLPTTTDTLVGKTTTDTLTNKTLTSPIISSLSSASATALTLQSAGTTGLTIDTSQNLSFNSGYGSVATAYGCRAWVNFNGTGTVAIRASGNVTSITDNGTGDYTVNFTTTMVDANYGVSVGSTGYTSTNTVTKLAIKAGASITVPALKTTTQLQMQYSDTASPSTNYDCNEANVAIFR
jgi:hypothetical protein